MQSPLPTTPKKTRPHQRSETHSSFDHQRVCHWAWRCLSFGRGWEKCLLVFRVLLGEVSSWVWWCLVFGCGLGWCLIVSEGAGSGVGGVLWSLRVWVSLWVRVVALRLEVAFQPWKPAVRAFWNICFVIRPHIADDLAPFCECVFVCVRVRA